MVKVSLRPPTAAKILEWNFDLGKVVNDTEACDPMPEQSLYLKCHCICTLH